jgi:hypothetical protein
MLGRFILPTSFCCSCADIVGLHHSTRSSLHVPTPFEKVGRVRPAAPISGMLTVWVASPYLRGRVQNVVIKYQEYRGTNRPTSSLSIQHHVAMACRPATRGQVRCKQTQFPLSRWHSSHAGNMEPDLAGSSLAKPTVARGRFVGYVWRASRCADSVCGHHL